MKAISAIIPCFNGEAWIRETLKSLMAQKIDDLETVVIDDGSTDGSAGIVEKEFPHVRLVRTRNEGPSKARNLGTKISQGEFVQYLDADDLLAPRKLQIQLKALRDSGADIAYSKWQRLVETVDGQRVKKDVPAQIIRNPEIDLLTGDSWRPIHSYLFRRSAIEKTGGWNEGSPVIQDARFALDCALHGARFIYCPDALVYYRVHYGDSTSTRSKIAFNRDVLKNAIEVEEWFRAHGGGVNEGRKNALLKVYGYVARASFERDRDTFNSAYKQIINLDPKYIPEKPLRLRLASRILRYRNAEVLALCYRRIKSFFKKR